MFRSIRGYILPTNLYPQLRQISKGMLLTEIKNRCIHESTSHNSQNIGPHKFKLFHSNLGSNMVSLGFIGYIHSVIYKDILTRLWNSTIVFIFLHRLVNLFDWNLSFKYNLLKLFKDAKNMLLFPFINCCGN